MSLPTPVLDLAADVVPDAEEQGRLAFAYAHGALVAGFGTAEELGMVCVWDHQDVPDGAPAKATHVTQARFDQLLKTVMAGEGWADPGRTPLTDVADFAYGVLLSDEDGAGTAARGAVSEFPFPLVERSGRVLLTERDLVARELAELDDYWARADLLSKAVHRAYVAWFAAGDHYFPGARRRREYAQHFGMDPQVLELEHRVWQAGPGSELRDGYLAFVDQILADR
jgi:hypothetical protein